MSKTKKGKNKIRGKRKRRNKEINSKLIQVHNEPKIIHSIHSKIFSLSDLIIGSGTFIWMVVHILFVLKKMHPKGRNNKFLPLNETI